MIKLSYDLHIHSCLSPCGHDDMSPANILGMAALKGLDVIAITDHNSFKNCKAALSMAKDYDVIVIPAMELCTIEEVHVLCLFESLIDAQNFDEYVYDKLIKILNDENIFGKQEIYNEEDEIIGHEPYLLINATTISFDQVEELMKEHNGIMIPAHIDKNSNSLLSNLGFIPPSSKFVVAEIGQYDNKEEIIRNNPHLNKCNLITNSDAHYLHQIHEPVHYIYAKSRDIVDILKGICEVEELL